MATDDPQIQQLLSDLRDYNKDRRRTAVYKLGLIGGEDALQALMRAVRDDREDLIVRGRAAIMLGKMRDPRAVDPLIDALKAPGYQTPLNAAEALGRLGHKRAIAPLRDMVEGHQNARAREAAEKALSRINVDADGDDEPENAAPVGATE